MNRQFVEVGPDGRVYTSDQLGLYALSPDGELLWFVPEAGGGHPIDIGPDGGTLYVANGTNNCVAVVRLGRKVSEGAAAGRPKRSAGNRVRRRQKLPGRRQ